MYLVVKYNNLPLQYSIKLLHFSLQKHNTCLAETYKPLRRTVLLRYLFAIYIVAKSMQHQYKNYDYICIEYASRPVMLSTFNFGNRAIWRACLKFETFPERLGENYIVAPRLKNTPNLNSYCIISKEIENIIYGKLHVKKCIVGSLTTYNEHE